MTLLILAAGMGSRFGGLKQIEPIGPNGEFIIDYSIHDAKAAGFNKVVFVIKKEMLEDFKNTVGNRIEGQIEVEYVFQDIRDIPTDEIFDRQKPWGTGQAVLCAKSVIKDNFLVINADDFYGRDSFKKASEFLKHTSGNKFGLIGYKAENTLSKNGAVKRAICDIEGNMIKGLTECSVYDENGKLKWTTLKDGTSFETPKDKYVSMSMLLFTPEIFKYLENDFKEFFLNLKDNLKDEFLIHNIIDKHIKTNEISLELVKTNSTWYGVTYKEDKEYVVNIIKTMIKNGEYNESLWR